MRRLTFALALLFGLAGPIPAQDKHDIPPAKHSRGYIPLSPEKSKAVHAEAFKRHGHRMKQLVAASTPPAEFDAKDMGWTGSSGDQAQCGSCYLCSTVKTMTCSAVKAGVGKADLFRLSWQFGMDCHDFGGCNGGNGTEVIDWAVKNGWYAEADPTQTALYPSYSARSQQCRVPSGAKKLAPKDWLFITSDQGDHPATVDEFKAALMTYGYVNIALDAGGQFGNYTSGVITSLGNSIDHEINVRGWSDSKQALLLENQWGDWGGAKAPGDDCAWLSYKAVGALQDPFVVVWDTLPPPPPPPSVPVITSPTTASAVVGAPFAYQITATNAPTGYTSTVLALGLGYNASSGLISGTPTTVGTYVSTISATNSSGTGQATLTVTVALTPPPPGNVVITLTPDQVASVLAQAGGTTGVILTPEEIAVLKAIIGRAKKAPPTAPAPMTPATSVDPASVEKLAADLEKFKKQVADIEQEKLEILKKLQEAVDVLLDAQLKQKDGK